MGVDIVAKLLLNSDKFNSSLEQAKTALGRFGGDGSTSLTQLMGAFGKVAGGAAALVGSFKVLGDIINSTDRTADAWASTMQSVTTVTDQFYKSLALGDFTYFTQGLDSIIAKAHEAYDAMDRLEDVALGVGSSNAEESRKFATSMAIARDKTQSPDDRKAALAAAQESIKTMRESARVFYKRTVDALQASLASGSVLTKEQLSLDQIKGMIRIDTHDDSDQRIATLRNQYDTYKEQADKIKSELGEASQTQMLAAQYTGNGRLNPEYAKEMAKLNEKYKDAILYTTIWVRMTKEERESLSATADAAEATTQRAEDMASSLNRVKAQLYGAYNVGGTGGGKSNEAPSPTGSMAYYDAKIKAYQEAWQSATDKATRDGLESAISYVTTQKFVAQYGQALTMQMPTAISPAFGASTLPALPAAIPQQSTSGSYPQALAEMSRQQALADRLSSLEQVLPYAQGDELKSITDQIEALKAQRKATGKASDEQADFASMLNATTTAAQTLFNTFAAGNNDAQKMLNLLLGIISAVSGIVKGNPSGMITGIAGMVSGVGGLFMADGGVVTRPTYGVVGEAGPEAVIPLDRLKALTPRIQSPVDGTLGGKVEFKIKDSELVGILARHARIADRKA